MASSNPFDSISGKLDDVAEKAADAVNAAAAAAERAVSAVETAAQDRADQAQSLEHKLTNYQLATELRFLRLEKRVTDRMDSLEKAQGENTELTQESLRASLLNAGMVRDMHEIIEPAQAFFSGCARIGRGIGVVARFLAIVIKTGGAIAGGLTAIIGLIYVLAHYQGSSLLPSKNEIHRP